jgi:TolA-binding protein
MWGQSRHIVNRTLIIVVGVGLAAAWLGEWAAHRRSERNYQTALAVQRQLELQVGELRTDRDRLHEALSTEQQRVNELSSTVSAREAQLQEAVERLSQEEQVIQELQAKLLVMQRQFDLLQGELAMSLQARGTSASQATGGTVQLEKVVVTHSASAIPASHGRVISVNPEWRFVILDLGWDVVKIGDVVALYRNEALLGKAKIDRVQERVSAATLLPDWIEAEIQINDVVRVL